MYKEDFPIFKNNSTTNFPLIYLDSASTTQKPQVMIDRLKNYYEYENANIHRGLYKIAEKSTQDYEITRAKVAELCNLKFNKQITRDNIVFTRNTTESINIAATSFIKPILTENSEILISELDHHSNILPWIKLAEEINAKIVWIPLREDLTLDLAWLGSYVELKHERIAVVAFTGASNITGDLVDYSEIYKETNKFKIPLLIDGAQWMPHVIFDDKKYDLPDFFAFSSHKICGPNGVGILIVKDLTRLKVPYQVGGSTIESVKKNKIVYKDSMEVFEAGTQDIASVIAFSTSIDYLLSRDLSKVHSHLDKLNEYMWEKLNLIEKLRIYSPPRNFENPNSIPVFSFTFDNIHPHDISQILSDENICVRAGQHCGGIFHEKIDTSATTRASLYFYNEMSDVDKLIAGIQKSREVFI